MLSVSGFSDKLESEALRAAPTDRLTPADKAFCLFIVGLNLSVEDKKAEFYSNFEYPAALTASQNEVTAKSFLNHG